MLIRKRNVKKSTDLAIPFMPSPIDAGALDVILASIVHAVRDLSAFWRRRTSVHWNDLPLLRLNGARDFLHYESSLRPSASISVQNMAAKVIHDIEVSAAGGDDIPFLLCGTISQGLDNHAAAGSRAGGIVQRIRSVARARLGARDLKISIVVAGDFPLLGQASISRVNCGVEHRDGLVGALID